MLNALNNYDPIYLNEMSSVRLMDRHDTKLIMSRSLLNSVLEELINEYYVLEIGSKRAHAYESLYYDTASFKTYREHHNGRLNRYKLRYRSYVDSDLHYFEVKHKSNKNRTIKKRHETIGIQTSLGATSKDMVQRLTYFDPNELFPTLWIYFDRITLVNHDLTERITIDVNLEYKSYLKEVEASHPSMVIVEAKQKRFNRHSKIISTLHDYGVYPIRISKYCLGMLSCFDEIKRNAFKPKMLRISKITGNDYYRTIVTN